VITVTKQIEITTNDMTVKQKKEEQSRTKQSRCTKQATFDQMVSSQSSRYSMLKSRLAMLALSSVLLLSLTIGVSQTADAVYVGPIPNTSFKVGRVMARSVVINPETGQPILVEFDDQGNEVREVETGGYNIEDLQLQH